MTSPVDTSVKSFDSTMLGAPALSGTAGTTIGVLDACLVNGFDTRAASSIVVSGGVATVSYSGAVHSARLNSVILVSGVTDITSLNGEQKITAVGSGFVKFATAASPGTATGTISFKMAPLGWVKPFNGTNIGVYQSSDITSTKCYLRVDDTGTQTCRVMGYETMTDVNTGLGGFPLSGQILGPVTGGGWWYKSAQVNSTPVVWSIHGDGKIFYINIQMGTSTNASYQMTSGRVFGDPIPYRPGGDPYCCILNYATASGGMAGGVGNTYSSSANCSFATPRDFTGIGSAVGNFLMQFGIPVGSNSNSGITNLAGAFPSYIDGSLWLFQKFLAATSTGMPRALMPGLYICGQSSIYNNFKQGDTTPGTGALAGRWLRAATSNDDATVPNTASTTANTGIIFFDDTGPWR
jgi:hypothetical protein